VDVVGAGHALGLRDAISFLWSFLRSNPQRQTLNIQSSIENDQCPGHLFFSGYNSIKK
jgi:hypothetical protein